jgi:hypothetical protein
MSFIGYDNKYPVFCDFSSNERWLYRVTTKGKDSLDIQRMRTARFSLWDERIRLLWVNNDMEIYTMSKPNIDKNKDFHFIITTCNTSDTVFVELNSFYQSDYEPFAITEDRKTLFAVQPAGYQDENMGWYYDSIMKIDLTKTPLAVEKLPITGIEMQRIGNFLYYKGGAGDFENALLRVTIPEWDKVDTLINHVSFWFIKDSLIYAHMGGYVGQDEWLYKYGATYVAYSMNSRRCAYISKDKPPCSFYPILFEGEFCSPIKSGLVKIETPAITEFPYKQTFLPKNRKK